MKKINVENFHRRALDSLAQPHPLRERMKGEVKEAYVRALVFVALEDDALPEAAAEYVRARTISLGVSPERIDAIAGGIAAISDEASAEEYLNETLAAVTDHQAAMFLACDLAWLASLGLEELPAEMSEFIEGVEILLSLTARDRAFLAKYRPFLTDAKSVDATEVVYQAVLGGYDIPDGLVSFFTPRMKPYAGQLRTIMLSDKVPMDLIYCPSGTFKMGSPESEPDHNSDELLHTVKLTSGFWLGRYPVTQGQWAAVTGDWPSANRDSSSYWGGWRVDGKANPNYPVNHVSWDLVQDFLRRLNSAQPKLKARMPTEAEWEYACRAGTTGAYAGSGDIDLMGWYGRNSGGALRQVGQLAPNAWGFHDMHGTVLEWCYDRYGSYPSGTAVDPKGPEQGDSRILRGGQWNYSCSSVRSAARFRRSPSDVYCRRGDIYDHYGFRLACDEVPMEG